MASSKDGRTAGEPTEGDAPGSTQRHAPVTTTSGAADTPSTESTPLAPVAPAAPAILQYQLFARKAEIQFPPAIVTADSLGEVEADDQLRYFVKGDAHGGLVRASEWLGTLIAEEVRIGAPTPMLIEMIDGTIVFGSRSIPGVFDAITTIAYLSTPTLTNSTRPATGLQAVLSAIYALDLFIFNDDRHANNYLSLDDNGTRRFYAFDFSRAMFWQWPWNDFPPATCNTELWEAYSGASMDLTKQQLLRLWTAWRRYKSTC